LSPHTCVSNDIGEDQSPATIAMTHHQDPRPHDHHRYGGDLLFKVTLLSATIAFFAGRAAGQYACQRPNNWCTHETAVFVSVDCDGDGGLDALCYDGDDNRWMIRSSDQCQEKTSVPDSACPAVFIKPPPPAPPACQRPNNWCTHETAVFVSVDCDGDGGLDIVCYDGDDNRWMRRSSDQCQEKTSVPDSACPAVFIKPPPPAPPACQRPNNWCTHETAVFVSVDCDGDGGLDIVCYDGDDNRWMRRSSDQCQEKTSVPDSACPAVFIKPPPPAPAGVCPQKEDYVGVANMDRQGNTLMISSNPEADCTVRPTCMGFNSDGELKTASAPFDLASAGKCFYYKDASLMDTPNCGALTETYSVNWLKNELPRQAEISNTYYNG
ncbi:hypothetical protein Vafri_6543, partial [Volvox africanus]